MTEIVIKRVYSGPVADDGFRVLVDRLWPRGLAKATAALARWDKDVAPSSELRIWFSHRSDRFEEFTGRYQDELDDSGACAALVDAAGVAERITLLYAARDPEVNHARVLRDYLSAPRDDLTAR